MRRLKSRSASGPVPCDLKSPCPPYRTAGMAILISLCLSISVLSACSDLPDSVPEITLLPTSIPVSQPSPEVVSSPIPTWTPISEVTPTPTPVPTVLPSASTIILQLAVAPANAEIPYDRDDWKHWIDADDDCQDTRQEALLEESTALPKFTDDRECRIATGRWTDPFTGTAFTDPGDLDIDHMVPLINAHRSGAHAWDRERKSEYANDLSYDGHLIAVSASANRSKGGKGPDEWRPPNTEYWCQYALDWVAIKREWDLTATEPEADALSQMLSTCETRVFIQTERREDSQSKETPTPTVAPSPVTALPTSIPATASTPQTKPPTETPVVVAPTRTVLSVGTPTPFPVFTLTPTPISVDFPKPLPDHNCSDFDTWSEAQAFFELHGGPGSDPHQLDRDGDGIACKTLPGAPDSSITPESSDGEIASLTPTCSDFGTWDEAQAFFVSNGGPESDPYKLDPDGNGVPCQSLIGAPAPTPTLTPTPTPIQDRDCSDFDTWSEAQDFYELEGGPHIDPHRLDRDRDGIACQSLPGAPNDESDSKSSTNTEPIPTPKPKDTHNCSDFSTWSEAQAFFVSYGGPESDPHRLDRDGDGVACQSLPGAPGDEPTSNPSDSATPTPTPKPEDTHNCSDFDTWSEAQSFYESEGGPASDPHRLDRDGDGVACQSLPGAPGDEPTSNPSGSAAPTPTPKPKDTHNCSDFSTWSEAQSFYESEGGPGSDPHRLDRDGDGVACQSLPGAPGGRESTSSRPESTAPTPTPKPKDTHNCSDFDTWSEAQDFYESEGGPASDPHRLDRDRDGVACQSLPGAPGEPTPTPASIVPTPTSEPTPDVDTHNCSDFATQPEAQAFYESEGGPASDPHRLDNDGDGVACQSLPGAPKSTSKSADTHNCSDFDTWSEAQEFYESEGGPDSDPHRLDRDRDGIACVSLPGAPKSPTPTPTSTSA